MNTRELAFDILKKIEYEDLYVGDILDKALKIHQFADKRERAFLTRLVEGVTERKLSLDCLIDKFSRNKKNGNKKAGNRDNNGQSISGSDEGQKSSKRSKQDVRILLRMGIYQIRYMDSVPDRAAIDETVELAKASGYTGLTGYINGLLRNVARAKDEGRLDSFLMSRPETRYSTPDWICRLLNETYGREDAKKILEDQYAEHDTVIRINNLKTSVQEYRELLDEKGVTVKPGVLSERCLRISGYDIQTYGLQGWIFHCAG